MHSKAKGNRPLWVIGVDAAKEALYARLKITEHGPGFCHFPISDQYDLGYFEQLTAETCRVRYTKGFAHREWTKKAGARNEAQQIEAMMVAKSGGEEVHRQPVPPPSPSERQERRPWIDQRDWFNRRSDS